MPPPELGPGRAGAPLGGQWALSGSRWQDLKKKEQDSDLWLKAERARPHSHIARSSRPAWGAGPGEGLWGLADRTGLCCEDPVQVGGLARRFGGLRGRLQEPCGIAGGWACRELGQIGQVRLPGAPVTPPPLCPHQMPVPLRAFLSSEPEQGSNPGPLPRQQEPAICAASVCGGHSAILTPGSRTPARPPVKCASRGNRGAFPPPSLVTPKYVASSSRCLPRSCVSRGVCLREAAPCRGAGEGASWVWGGRGRGCLPPPYC